MQRNVEMYIALPMHSRKLCTQWLCSVGNDRVFIGLMGGKCKPRLYIVSWQLRPVSAATPERREQDLAALLSAPNRRA